MKLNIKDNHPLQIQIRKINTDINTTYIYIYIYIMNNETLALIENNEIGWLANLSTNFEPLNTKFV